MGISVLPFNNYMIYWKFDYSIVDKAKDILFSCMPKHYEKSRTLDRISLFHLLQSFILKICCQKVERLWEANFYQALSIYQSWRWFLWNEHSQWYLFLFKFSVHGWLLKQQLFELYKSLISIRNSAYWIKSRFC